MILGVGVDGVWRVICVDCGEVNKPPLRQKLPNTYRIYSHSNDQSTLRALCLSSNGRCCGLFSILPLYKLARHPSKDNHTMARRSTRLSARKSFTPQVSINRALSILFDPSEQPLRLLTAPESIESLPR